MSAARVIYRTATFPLPAGTPAWVVWDDGSVDGPWLAVAIAHVVCDVEVEADVVMVKELPDKPHVRRLRDAFGNSRDGDEEIETITNAALDWAHSWVLVLWPGFGNSDSAWTQQKYVFFDQESAEMEGARRRAEAKP